jgi:hypothetical protein
LRASFEIAEGSPRPTGFVLTRWSVQSPVALE